MQNSFWPGLVLIYKSKFILAGFVPVKLGNQHISLVVDLPQTDEAGNILAEIKQAIAS